MDELVVSREDFGVGASQASFVFYVVVREIAIPNDPSDS